MRNKVLVLIFYLFVSFFFTFKVQISNGLIIGSDWSFPETFSQMKSYANTGIFTWTNAQSLFGQQANNSNDYLFRIFIGVLPALNIGGKIFAKIFLIFLFTLAGFSVYLYCRFLKLNEPSSILGGFFLITSPLFFNYIIMGWTHVLLSVGLLPFALMAFTKSIKEQKVSGAIITGLLYSIAMLQSQTLVWYPIAFILLSFFLVRSKKEVKICIKSLIIIFSIFSLIHSPWLISSLLFPGSVISQAVSRFDINRFGTRLSGINFLRLWGSLFNYQYESAFPSSLLFITFIPPIIAYLALILRKKDKMVLYFSLLSFVPLLFFIGRGVFQYIPFSAVIRDVSRFMVLSTVSYSVLIAMTIDALIGKAKKVSIGRHKSGGRRIGYILLILIILSSYPFWTGELYGKGSKHDWDVRMRTLKFPSEYYEAENILLAKRNSNHKALYLPIGGMSINLLNDKRFSGPHHEVVDIFSAYSPIPGATFIAGRESGIAQDFTQILQSNIDSNENSHLLDLLNLVNVKYIIIRLNMSRSSERYSMKDIARRFETKAGLRRIYKNKSVVIFENLKVFPRIYSVVNSVVVGGGVNDLTSLLTLNEVQPKGGILFSKFLEDEQKKFILNRSGKVLVFNTPLIVKSGDEEHAVDNYRMFEDGRYEILVKFKNWLKNKNLRSLSLKMDGKTINLKNFVFKTDGWVSLGHHNFKKGNHRLFVYRVNGSEEEIYGDSAFTSILESSQKKKNTIREAYIVLRKDKRTSGTLPEISFKRINPTKYVAQVSGATNPYLLVFSELFHSGWKGYIRETSSPKSKVQSPKSSLWDTWFKKPLPENKHFLVNGYANSWWIEKQGDYEIVLEFWPQRLFYIGLMISGITLLFCLGYLVWQPLRRRIAKRREY
jgi:hypothetical protein